MLGAGGLKDPGIRAFLKGEPMPMMHAMAQVAFGRHKKSWLERVARYFGIRPKENSLYGTLEALVEFFLSPTPDALVEILAQRMV